ncbi:MAG: PEGA domain-containing protein [Methanosarcinales archaeon]|nr:PEGA domain-containing protein [Methanosarcinales archaeon]
MNSEKEAEVRSMQENSGKKPFWSTRLGIITQIVGLLAALITLYAALHGGYTINIHTPSPNFTTPTELKTEPVFKSTPVPLLVTVHGTVTDKNGIHVGNLKVSIDDSSDITGEDGTYIIQDIPVGVSIIRVERMNKVIYKKPRQIEGDEGIEVVDISIPAEEGVTGEITVYSYDTSAAGAYVYIDGHYQGEMYWDDDHWRASFQSTDVSSGMHQIKITQSGYGDFIESVTVISGEVTEVELELYSESVETTGIGGIVVYSYDTSAAGAYVYIDGYYQGVMYWDYYNEYASFQSTDVSSGMHQIKITQSGYEDFIESVTVISGEVTEVEVGF